MDEGMGQVLQLIIYDPVGYLGFTYVRSAFKRTVSSVLFTANNHE